MTKEIVRSDQEIDDLIGRCIKIEDSGKNPYWGMTYAEGLLHALEWITEEDQDHPLDG